MRDGREWRMFLNGGCLGVADGKDWVGRGGGGRWMMGSRRLIG